MNSTSFFYTNQSLPPHIKAIIGPVPRTGEGVHRWLFVSSLKLHGKLPPDEIVKALQAAVADCGRHVPDSEIRDAVENSAPGKLKMRLPAQSGGGANAWPKVDHAAVRRVVSSIHRPIERLTSGAFRAGFPQSYESFVPAVIGLLFPGDPLICVGEENYCMRCRHFSEWGSQLASMQFIVPSPMTAESGFNQSGEVSSRCLNNTGPRRYLVIEFDDASPEEQAAFHIHLAELFLLAAVVHSGRRSWHGWYHVAGRSDSEIEAFMRCAVSLGADPHTFVRCQPVRVPGGLRRDGLRSVRQEVLFLNPELPKA